MEYEINGGVNTITGDVEWLEAHGGVLYVKGKVGTLVHHGGVIYDQRRSNRIEYVTDKMTESERRQFREHISNLETKLRNSEHEVLNLHRKLQKEEFELPPDDVLVDKIERLQCELARERADRKREVEELNERIDVALEINAKLRRMAASDNGHRQSQVIADEHIDILATLMSLYPFTPDKDLVYEFGIPVDRIRETARVLGVIKSSDARREAVEYLRKQHIEFIQRRGGDQTKGKKKKTRLKTNGHIGKNK